MPNSMDRVLIRFPNNRKLSVHGCLKRGFWQYGESTGFLRQNLKLNDNFKRESHKWMRKVFTSRQSITTRTYFMYKQRICGSFSSKCWFSNKWQSKTGSSRIRSKHFTLRKPNIYFGVFGQKDLSILFFLHIFCFLRQGPICFRISVANLVVFDSKTVKKSFCVENKNFFFWAGLQRYTLPSSLQENFHVGEIIWIMKNLLTFRNLTSLYGNWLKVTKFWYTFPPIKDTISALMWKSSSLEHIKTCLV